MTTHATMQRPTPTSGPSRNGRRRGFTLNEVVVTIGIIAVLPPFLLPNLAKLDGREVLARQSARSDLGDLCAIVGNQPFATTLAELELPARFEPAPGQNPPSDVVANGFLYHLTRGGNGAYVICATPSSALMIGSEFCVDENCEVMEFDLDDAEVQEARRQFFAAAGIALIETAMAAGTEPAELAGQVCDSDADDARRLAEALAGDDQILTLEELRNGLAGSDEQPTGFAQRYARSAFEIAGVGRYGERIDLVQVPVGQIDFPNRPADHALAYEGVFEKVDREATRRVVFVDAPLSAARTAALLELQGIEAFFLRTARLFAGVDVFLGGLSPEGGQFVRYYTAARTARIESACP